MQRSRRLFAMGSLALLALGWRPFAASAQPQRTRYDLTVTISDGSLSGRGTIDFVNSSTQPVHELWFHLYANAFESGETVFAKEGGLGLRGVAPERRGSISLTQLDDDLERDLLARAEHELVPNDRTQLRVPLYEPLGPGRTLRLSVRFDLQFPSLVARMGRSGDFYMVAQWFPKLARLTRDGRFRSTPYHGSAEFDSDFADYTLYVTVPPGFAIAAPGARVVARPDGAARAIEIHSLMPARDFAFAFARDVTVAHARSKRVAIDVYAPRGYRGLAQRQATRVVGWLDQLEDELGTYPYDRLVVVLPPLHAAGAQGMEYAGLFTGAVADPLSAIFPALGPHDFVSAHELAHQWFPMLVSNDEIEAPLLDEGLAEWLGMHVLREPYSRERIARLCGVPFDAFDVTAALLANAEHVPSSLGPARGLPLQDLASAMYWRPAIALETLAERHGRARVLRALHGYAQQRFTHGTLDDFTAAFDRELGAGLSKRELLPILDGTRDAVAEFRSARADAPKPSRSLFSRLVALLQQLLAWVGP